MSANNTHKNPSNVCFIPEHIQLECLKRKIRRAEEPNNPKVLDDFFTLDKKHRRHDLLGRRENAFAQFNLLLSTVKDESLPSYWREHCLNVIYFPLAVLKQLANCEESLAEVNYLYHQLRYIRI